MSDSNTILSQANVPTIAAVALILGLLSLSFSFYVHRQVMASTAIGMTLDVNASKKNDALEKQIATLNERLASLEAKAAAAPVANDTTTAASAAPAAPAN